MRRIIASIVLAASAISLSMLCLICIEAKARAESPQQPVQLSIEYYQQRITEIDARAAALTHENTVLRAEIERLKKKSPDQGAVNGP